MERHVLWNNLIKVTEMHDMPWVLAGDFNEPLMEDDKFRGRAVIVSKSRSEEHTSELQSLV